jgi:hypothetical protein
MSKRIFLTIIITLIALSSYAEDMQAKRKALIQEMIHKGLFTKVESNQKNIAVAWVDSAFYRQSYDDKKTYINVIYAYYLEEEYKKGNTMNIVILKDSRTGKKVGRYSALLGLEID